MSQGTNITKYPIHLGLGASSIVQPEFTGDLEWYTAYSDRTAQDDVEGRLVSMFSFDRDWDMWEMHPKGSEVVLCTAGTMTIHQERADGSKNTVTLNAGEYAINDPGTWHTADVSPGATAVFITAGLGTEMRPR